MHRCLLVIGTFVMLQGGEARSRGADPFQDKILPFLNTYCLECHNEKKKNGELDLKRFTSASKMLEDFRQWEHVVTFVKKEEMPPAKSTQPTAARRAEFITTLEKVLLAEAGKLAGDPGVVPPRRLTNAEYDYSIHDLTGHDIRPAKTFPIDPASGEGFNNTGEALTMSPNLFKKYYAAAEFVADHALITNQQLRFAPHPVVTFADRQKYFEQEIIRFYERHAVDYEQYLSTLWQYQHRPADQQELGLNQVAVNAKLSERYLKALWELLRGNTNNEGPVAWLRQRWNALPTPTKDNKADQQAAIRRLAVDIQRLSKQLCPPEIPAIGANAGNGPIDHLARRRKMAETRDTYDNTNAKKQPLTLEYKIVPDQQAIQLVIELANVADVPAEGVVLLNGSFSTNSETTDGKRKWSLRAIVTDHAADVAAKLAFGMHPNGAKLDADTFALKAPTRLEITIPAKAFAFKAKGTVTFTLDSKLDATTQTVTMLRLFDRLPTKDEPTERAIRLIDPKHPAAGKLESSSAAFCRLFPSRFFYVDSTRGLSAGFHLIEGFFRDDQPLCRTVLNDAERKQLDNLWDELALSTGIWEKLIRGFVFFERSERNFLKHPDFDAFKEEDPNLATEEMLVQFKEAYLKRSNVKLTGTELAQHPISIFFDDIRRGVRQRTETLKQITPHMPAELLKFAAKAYGRDLTTTEQEKLIGFYNRVAKDPEHGVEAAVRASIIRVLVSPAFCMRFVPTPAGNTVAPLPDLALAARLSHLIHGSVPDAELVMLAKAGKLNDPEVLKGQVKRLLQDPKAERFTREFFGQWLGYREFLSQEAVNRQTFPAFDDALKQAMFEEPTRFITHLIKTNQPITKILDSDVTMVNQKLAQHYGLPFQTTGGDWQLATGLHQQGRAGVLGMAVFLTKNSQPQRTSPVKRGFWVVNHLLGEHIPPPPPDVAVLPAKETDTNGKTIRQLLKLHVEDTNCARCHQRFDSFGLAMEGFDPIGKKRAKDLAGRPIDNIVALPTGKEARGLPEFGDYLAKHRKAELTKTLCYKFLGYSLGRSLQLSDQPLLEKMQAELAKNNDHLSILFELVVLSPQFRNQRCLDFNPTQFKAALPNGAER